MRRIGFLAVALSGALVMGACGNAAERAAEQVAGVEDVEIDGDNVTVTDDEGNTTSVGTSLPDGWPSEFPVPGGAEPTWGAATEMDGGTGFSALFSADLSSDELQAFYADALSSDGWSVTATFNQTGAASDGGDLISFAFEGQGWSGTLLIGVQQAYTDAEGDFSVTLIPSEAIEG